MSHAHATVPAAARAVCVAVAGADTLGESPAWSARTQSLFWVDIRAPSLQRLHVATGAHRTWPMPDLCCGVVPAGTGVVVAFRTGIAHFDPDSERLTPLAEVEPPALDNRLNEAKCDRAGRLWVGSMRDFGAAVTGSLYVIDGALRPRRVLSDICIPNGLGWSPDNRTMYFTDTRAGAVMSYPFDLASGTLDQGAVLLASGAAPGNPDGCAVDADGGIWNARFRAGVVVRIAPAGDIVERIDLPVTQPTACALGGPDLRTLFVTTARQHLSADDLRSQPAAGALFAIRVDTPGIADAEFGGVA